MLDSFSNTHILTEIWNLIWCYLVTFREMLYSHFEKIGEEEEISDAEKEDLFIKLSRKGTCCETAEITKESGCCQFLPKFSVEFFYKGWRQQLTSNSVISMQVPDRTAIVQNPCASSLSNLWSGTLHCTSSSSIMKRSLMAQNRSWKGLWWHRIKHEKVSDGIERETPETACPLWYS